MLTEDQKARAVRVMKEYLTASSPDGSSPAQHLRERDCKRIELIKSDLKPLVERYLTGQVPLNEFKSTVDGLNKRHGHWGFKGIKGQMFFNMLVNTADENDVDAELKAAIAEPASEDLARSRLKSFVAFVTRVGETHVEAGGAKHGRPKVSSSLFFLSYFWQIQDSGVWPVYYTNSVNASTDMNLWQPSGDPAADYITFKHLHEELAALFSDASGNPFNLYDVENVFWFKDGNPYGAEGATEKPQPDKVPETDTAKPQPPLPVEGAVARLPESYVPPIIAVLPRMACGDLEIEAAAKASGTTLPRAFEKHINAAFTILGYETKLLGQGAGRVPDGRAIDHDNSYAILWDAKVRTNGYCLGTDDRTIREYIDSQCRELKRRRTIRNIYYLVISSRFKDDHDDAVRFLKMETDVSEVCLVESEALAEIANIKLRDPHGITLGPDGIQRLFSTSGIITAETVSETLE